MNGAFKRLRRRIQEACASDTGSNKLLAIVMVQCIVGLFIVATISSIYSPLLVGD